MLAKPLYVRWSGERSVTAPQRRRSLQAHSLNMTKTGFVFIKRLPGRRLQNKDVLSACQERQKARTPVLLQNCNLCFRCGNKTQPFVSCLGGGGGTPERPPPGSRREAAGLAPAQAYRGARSRDGRVETTAPALLRNRAWMEMKAGAGGGDPGRTERGNEG